MLDRDVRTRAWSDVALGGLLVVSGAVAILDPSGTSMSRDARLFPLVIGGLLVAFGAVLLVRGAVGRRLPARRWRLRALVVVVVVILAVDVIVALDRVTVGWIDEVALRFGPPELTAFGALQLAVATALARLSRLRAVGMMLLGLLLAAVGIDTITGQLRLTLGLTALLEGIDPIVVLLGLVIVADGLVCLVSPSLLLSTYGRLVVGWRDREVSTIAAVAMRVVAALAIAAAAAFAFQLHARGWEIGALLVFGVFGIAAKLGGWNRLVLILALARGDLLEQTIRQAMLISDGDPTIFLRRPVSAAMLLLTAAVLAGATLLSVRGAMGREGGGWTARPR